MSWHLEIAVGTDYRRQLFGEKDTILHSMPVEREGKEMINVTSKLLKQFHRDHIRKKFIEVVHDKGCMKIN